MSEYNEETERYYCTECGAEVSFYDKICSTCGADVSIVEETVAPERPTFDRYPILRVIAGGYRLLAFATVILAFIGAYYFYSELPQEAGLPMSIFAIMVGFISLVTLLAQAETLEVFLGIEENTRIVANLLVKQSKSSH